MVRIKMFPDFENAYIFYQTLVKEDVCFTDQVEIIVFNECIL